MADMLALQTMRTRPWSRTFSGPRSGEEFPGARVLGDGSPKIGAHGKPVLFLHPKDFCGALVELEQA